MATIEEFKKDIPSLVEAGLIAIKQGDEESAKKLFNAVGAIDPANIAKDMGFGLIALHKMELATAKKLFQKVLDKEPENYRAKAFLSFACVLSTMDASLSNEEKVENLQKAAEYANTVLSKSKEETSRTLAQSVLDWEKELEARAGAK